MEKNHVTILVVGGDSAEVFRRRAGKAQGQIEHWSGRKTRDLARPIPKAIDIIVVVLDRVSHALVKRVRLEASRRDIPIHFQRRSGRKEAVASSASESMNFLMQYPDAS